MIKDPMQTSSAIKTALIAGMGLIGIILSLTPIGYQLDALVFDTLLVHSTNKVATSDIIVVAIDEDSFAVIEKQWPWSRHMHARLLENLFDMGAKTVVFDILFPELSNIKDDRYFAQILNNKVVLAASIETRKEERYQSSIKVLPHVSLMKNKSRTGMDILPIERDGFVRGHHSYINEMPSLALAAAKAYSGNDTLQSDTNRFGTSPKSLINFAGPPGTFKTVSYYRVLEPGKYLADNPFADKLVFIGFSVKNTVSLITSHADHYSTPYVRFGAEQMAGVEIQANIAANYLHEGFIKKANPVTLAVIIIFWCALISWWSFTSRVRFGNVMMVVFAMSLLVIIWQFFTIGRLFIPVAGIFFPFFLMTGSSTIIRYYDIQKRKNYIRKVFSRYVSSSVVNYLLKHPEKLNLGGAFFEGTVLFLDIKNFTAMTSQIPAEELVAILSRYLGCFSDIVFANHGMMDKIAGDAIMAVWGVPIKQKNHAELACRAALEIEQAYYRLQKKAKSGSEPRIDIRIGINSGRLLAGNIGGQHFSDFTVHGVDVNLANKLETLNNEYGTRILISGQTCSQLPGFFQIKEKDRLRPDGYETEVTIFELYGNTL